MTTSHTATTAERFRVSSSSFEDHQEIPHEHAEKDQSWSLAIEGVPEGTKALAIVVHDPDAPSGDFTHWILYNVPPSTRSLASGIAPEELPHGTLQGKNDWGATGFRGPAPPSGRHRYVTTLYALDALLPDLHEPRRAVLNRALAGHVIAQADLVGTYAKP